MLITEIVRRVNQALAGERHTYSELVMHLDGVIDDINSKLNSNFPAFSELPLGASEYTAFPDRYLRMVVIPGTAHKYFVTDEEGLDVAPAYALQYQENLFIMVRDYFALVPEQYRSNTGNQGTASIGNEDAVGMRGLFVDGQYFNI